MEKPKKKPFNPCFSSGPCPKRPGWEPGVLSNALLGRSHRSEPGKERLQFAIAQTREVLQVPEEYRIGIVAGSDTGAVEMALWNLLGERAVQVLAWESFGNDWVKDIVNQLKIPNTKVIQAKYGKIVNVSSIAGRHRSIVSGIHYVASKSALIGYTRQLAFELGKFNINVHNIVKLLI